MPRFPRDQHRMRYLGVCLNAPIDALPADKLAIALNARSYIDGTVQSRDGLVAIAGGTGFGGPVHAIGRLNDPTPFAGAAFYRVFGVGVNLRAGNAAYPQVDTGYSGNPLALVPVTLYAAPNPWILVADSSRMRKLDTNAHVYQVGIAPPVNPPSGVLQPLFVSFISDFSSGVPWVNAGTAASALGAVSRVNTTISQILYDSGVSGNVSVVPTSMAQIDTGCMITFQGGETVPVQQVTIPIVNTTIAAILFDAGATGACTIQPTASIGTGAIQAPTILDYQGRYGLGVAVPRGTVGTPPTPPDPSRSIRQVDFPVNCLVTLNTGGGTQETVRILSVAIGPDGIQSFRCVTTSTHAAGETLTGVGSFRVSTAGTFSAGQTLVASGQTNTITPSGSPPIAVGGLQTGGGWAPINNLATINNRATMPDDDIHVCVRFSDCTVVQTVRIYLDVDATTNNFLQNYYFFEWRANDIIAAIQNVNAASVAGLQAARTTTVTNAAVNQAIARNASPPASRNPAAATANNALAAQLALGNNQWIELKCKVRDLERVGTDPSRTLQNVAAAEILVSMAGPSPITVDYDAFWLSGGYGPDVADTTTPYTWAYRYRSSLTGARSLWSPMMRGGLQPRRQSCVLTGVQSADPQVDLVDWARMGASLDRGTLAGTTANSNPPSFTDVYSDSVVSGAEAIAFDTFQPWATTDLPRTGTCNVAGSAVSRVSGANFNTSWAPGTPIIINGQTYTLYSQPASTTLLFINENAGSGTGVAFTIPQATLLAQPLPCFWGDFEGIYFACGDPNNPGTLYWTQPNNPDATSDANSFVVTPGSDPLMNGGMYDGLPVVFSTADLYTVLPSASLQAQVAVGASATQFVPQKTVCGKGLWNRWGLAFGSPRGIYFLTETGICRTAGGSAAESITDKDLRPLFPHDGLPGQAVNGINPPDMTQTTRLRLSYVGGWVYFDYVDSGGTARTLAYDETYEAWWPDQSAPGIVTRLWEPGAAVLGALLGGTDGSVYNPSGVQDNGAAMACQAAFVANEGDARQQKLYRDLMIEADLTAAALTATLGLTNNTVGLGSTALGGKTGRAAYLVNVLPTIGAWGTNLTVSLAWTAQAVGIPILYVWDIAAQPGPELASSWLSGPTTHELSGYQVATLAMIAYSATAAVTFTIIIDGVLYTYSLPSTGGLFAKAPVWLSTVKGLTFQYGAQSTTPFQLFHLDTEVWVTAWGQPGYQRVRPFAGQVAA